MILPRLLAAFLLCALAMFGIFGFAATFEPPGWPMLRIAYGVGVFVLLGLAGMILRSTHSGPHDAPGE